MQSEEKIVVKTYGYKLIKLIKSDREFEITLLKIIEITFLENIEEILKRY